MNSVARGLLRDVTEPGNRLRVPLWCAAAAAALCLLAAAGRDFWAPDEPDFAEHVREMLERKSLLLPYENGKPYSEKPILYYWALAATTPFTGGDVTPLGTRVPSALAADGYLPKILARHSPKTGAPHASIAHLRKAIQDTVPAFAGVDLLKLGLTGARTTGQAAAR